MSAAHAAGKPDKTRHPTPGKRPATLRRALRTGWRVEAQPMRTDRPAIWGGDHGPTRRPRRRWGKGVRAIPRVGLVAASRQASVRHQAQCGGTNGGTERLENPTHQALMRVSSDLSCAFTRPKIRNEINGLRSKSVARFSLVLTIDRFFDKRVASGRVPALHR